MPVTMSRRAVRLTAGVVLVLLAGGCDFVLLLTCQTKRGNLGTRRSPACTPPLTFNPRPRQAYQGNCPRGAPAPGKSGVQSSPRRAVVRRAGEDNGGRYPRGTGGMLLAMSIAFSDRTESQ
jgi:hypothetical protein